MRENKKFYTILIYSALSLIALFPAVLDILHYKYGSNYTGIGSDSYSMLKDLWWRSIGKFSEYNVDGKFILEGYPYSIRPVEENQIPFLIALFFTKLAGPVGGYNISVFISFLFTFLSTHLLSRKLLKDFHASMLASGLFTISAFHIYQCADHLDLSYFGIVPLFVFLLLWTLEKEDGAFWPALFFIAALSAFIHPYFPIMLSLFLGTFALLSFNLSWFRNPKFYLTGLITALLSYGVIKLWQISYVIPGQDVFSMKRDLKDLETYSFNLLDYFTPPAYSFFFPFANEWKTKLTEMSGSNFAENTVYLGLIPMMLIPYGLFKARREIKTLCKSMTGKIVIALFLAGILFSLGPVLLLGPVKIYRPSYLLFQFIPQFRTISRLAVLVLMAASLISAAVLKEKTGFNSLSIKAKNFIMAGLFLVLFLDQGHLHFPFYSDAGNVPPVYQAVEKFTPKEVNILELPYQWGFIPTYWTTRLERRSFYYFDKDSLNTQLVLKTNLNGLENLKRFSKENKIDYVIIHSRNKILGLNGEIANAPDEQMIFYKEAHYSYLLKM